MFIQHHDSMSGALLLVLFIEERTEAQRVEVKLLTSPTTGSIIVPNIRKFEISHLGALTPWKLANATN